MKSLTGTKKNACPQCGSFHILKAPKQAFFEKVFSGSKGTFYLCQKCSARFYLKPVFVEDIAASKKEESAQKNDTAIPSAKDGTAAKSANWYDDILKDAKTIVGEAITKFQDAEMHLKVFETMVKDLKEMKEKSADAEEFEALTNSLVSQIELIKEKSMDDPFVNRKALEILSYLKPETVKEESSKEILKKLLEASEERSKSEINKVLENIGNFENEVKTQLKNLNETLLQLNKTQAAKPFENSFVHEIKTGQESVISLLNDNIGRMWENFNSVNHIIQKFESRVGTLVGEITVLREDLIKHREENIAQPEEKKEKEPISADIISALNSKLSLMEMSLLSQWSSMLTELGTKLTKAAEGVQQPPSPLPDLEEIKTGLNNLSGNLVVLKKSVEENSMSTIFEEFKKSIDDYFYIRRLEISQKEMIEELAKKVSTVVISIENLKQEISDNSQLLEIKEKLTEHEKEKDNISENILKSISNFREDLSSELLSLKSENERIREELINKNQEASLEIKHIKEELLKLNESFDPNSLLSPLESDFTEINNSIDQLKNEIISFKAQIDSGTGKNDEIQPLKEEISLLKEKVDLQLVEISKIPGFLKDNNEEGQNNNFNLILEELNSMKSSYSELGTLLNGNSEELKSIKSELLEFRNYKGATVDDFNALSEKINALQLKIEKILTKQEREPVDTVNKITVKEADKTIKKESFLRNSIAVALALTLFYFGYMFFENDFFKVKKVPKSVPLPQNITSPAPPPVAVPPSDKKAEEEKDETVKIEEFINQWVTAWESKKIKDYFFFYSDNFKPAGKSLPEWRNTKKYIFSQKGKLTVILSEVKIKKENGRFVATFIQDYSFNQNKSRNKKSLVITSDSGTYKIISEESEKPR